MMIKSNSYKTLENIEAKKRLRRKRVVPKEAYPPRLGFITYGLERARGGIGRYTEELLSALRLLGWQPLVLQAGGGGQEGTCAIAGLLPGLLTVGQAQIAWHAKRNQLGLVHDPTGTMPLMLTGTRRVATIHDVIPYIYPETSTKLDKLIYRLWLPLAVRRLDAIITVSTQSKRDIVRYLPVKSEDVMVISEAAGANYRPLSRAQIQPVLKRYGINFPYLLYVGSLEARKNLPRLLTAYHRVRQGQTCPAKSPSSVRAASSKCPRLVIVGARKWKFSPIFETIQRLELEPDVYFTGYVEEEDLPALYNGADLFVFPSLYEGFGLPVLEAMACGVPVITSNSSSLPEVAGDAAILVDPLDCQAIAEAIQRVLFDNQTPNLAAIMREKGLARAKQFSWERTARETIAVYERVLAGETVS
jgi:glycosyltransferase involved in cell wall biosynthesis